MINFLFMIYIVLMTGLYILFLLIIVALFILYNKKNEHFQYLMTEIKPKKEDVDKRTKFYAKAVEYIPTTETNVLLDVDVLNYDECFELCRTTPDCDGFNYFLEKCKLYTGLKNFKPTVAYYRYW